MEPITARMIADQTRIPTLEQVEVLRAQEETLRGWRKSFCASEGGTLTKGRGPNVGLPYTAAPRGISRAPRLPAARDRADTTRLYVARTTNTYPLEVKL